jgi:6-phosphogluconolactonase/glucosamine-6-phosphate isomerase/deaminase
MKVFETGDLVQAAGAALTEALRASLKKPSLLMLSGGSAFSLLTFVPEAVLSPRLTVTVLDERFSLEPTINNFTQLEQTEFFARCQTQGVQFISTKVFPEDTVRNVADTFERGLREWKHRNTEGVIIATMGIGEDGHTAGMFPGEYGVDFDGDAWVVGYSAPLEVNQYPERITVTRTFLKQQVTEAVVFAVGERKYQYVQEIRKGDGESRKIPAGVLQEMNSVQIFTLPV